MLKKTILATWKLRYFSMFPREFCDAMKIFWILSEQRQKKLSFTSIYDAVFVNVNWKVSFKKGYKDFFILEENSEFSRKF